MSSRIDKRFPDKLLKKINKVIDGTKTNLQKFQKIEELADEYGFKLVGRGTNRLVVVAKKSHDYVFKIAVDEDGRFANGNSFQNGVLHKRWATSHEIDEMQTVCVQDRHKVMTKDEFKSYKDEILKVLKGLSKHYILFDVGYTTRCYKNWAIDKNGKAICIDHGYVEPITEDTDFRCRAVTMKGKGKSERLIQCKGTLEYNKFFTKLVCDKCGTEFDANILFRPRLDTMKAEAKAGEFNTGGMTSDEYDALMEKSRRKEFEREAERRKKQKEFIDGFYQKRENQNSNKGEVGMEKTNKPLTRRERRALEQQGQEPTHQVDLGTEIDDEDDEVVITPQPVYVDSRLQDDDEDDNVLGIDIPDDEEPVDPIWMVGDDEDEDEKEEETQVKPTQPIKEEDIPQENDEVMTEEEFGHAIGMGVKMGLKDTNQMISNLSNKLDAKIEEVKAAVGEGAGNSLGDIVQMLNMVKDEIIANIPQPVQATLEVQEEESDSPSIQDRILEEVKFLVDNAKKNDRMSDSEKEFVKTTSIDDGEKWLSMTIPAGVETVYICVDDIDDKYIVIEKSLIKKAFNGLRDDDSDAIHLSNMTVTQINDDGKIVKASEQFHIADGYKASTEGVKAVVVDKDEIDGDEVAEVMIKEIEADQSVETISHEELKEIAEEGKQEQGA